MQPKNPAVLCQHLNLGKTLHSNFDTGETWMQKQNTESNVVKTNSETFANQYEAEKNRKATNAWMILWRSSRILETLQPSMTTPSDIKQNWGTMSHPGITSQLHCLQYFLLARIECRLLGLGLVPRHSWVLSHLPWQRCKRQCSKYDVAVVQVEMVWCWNCLMWPSLSTRLFGVHLQWIQWSAMHRTVGFKWACSGQKGAEKKIFILATQDVHNGSEECR